jgi:hypothetical protein
MRHVRAIVLAAILAVLCLPASAAPGPRSGLPWASGASSGGMTLERIRRPLDLSTIYLAARGDFARMVQSAANIATYARLMPKGGMIAVAVPIVPQGSRGQLAACAAGRFDTFIRQTGTTLLARSEDHRLLMRLGWEANNMGSHPWALRSVADTGPYKGCFRRWVQVLRSLPGASRFTMVWNMALQGSYPDHIDRLYPGGDVVDIIGAQFFDRCPPNTDEATWQRRLNGRKANGSPIGPGSWLAYAKSKGKPFAIPEWAVGGPNKPGVCGASGRVGIDNPFVIRRLFAWLQANASSIAFESYFNGAGMGHALVTAEGPSQNPKAAAAYSDLW